MASKQEVWQMLQTDERTTVHEFTGERSIKNWEGVGDKIDARRAAARDWIEARIAHIQANMDEDPESNQQYDRQYRRDYLQDVLDGYEQFWWDLPAFPRDKGTDSEKCYIRERSFYCSFFDEGMQTEHKDAPYDEQQARKRENYEWLQDQRQYILDCVHGDVEGEEPGWDVKARRQRYDNFNIALQIGDQWDEFRSGDYVPRDERTDWRQASADWHEDHVGITEDPANSNCDERSDGIRNAQDKTANGTWLRYQPWCGCWAFMGLFQSGKVQSGDDSWMASVASIEDFARAGNAPFRGWTTDGSQAKKGDLVILFGRGQHVGTVRETPSGDTCKTWEGNTSSGSSGSQSNGGGSYKRSRSRSAEVYGYALVEDD